MSAHFHEPVHDPRTTVRAVEPVRAAHDDPEALLDMLSTLPDSLLVGFEPDGEHLDLHLRLLPDDERGATAGLLGFVAPASWTALGVVVSGRARNLVDGEAVGDGVAAFVVVTRSGRCASRMDHPWEPGEVADVRGIFVDAMHRALGLGSPGAEPHPASLVLAVWAQRLLGALRARGALEWDDALALHPGDPGTARPAPSTETLVEATVRAAEFRWGDLHRIAVAGAHADAFDLTGDEAAWMDSTMFARWALGSLTDPRVASLHLGAAGCDAIADRLLEVTEAIDPPGPTHGC